MKALTMIRRLFLGLVALPLLLTAADAYKTPEQIQTELNAAQANFDKAKEMFNPWYTGPLVTPSASMIPVGYGLIQPYIVVTDQFGQYDSHRHAHSLPHSKLSVNPFAALQFGMTPSTDISVVFGGVGNWQDGHQGGGFSDVSATMGFLINTETLQVPQIKFTLNEIFPIGRYQHLSSNGLALSGIGQGSWQTTFGLTMSKLFFWNSTHPFSTRLFLGYKIPVKVHVHGFNSYGGGFGTDGTVHPGNTFSADLGMELSLSQRWVIASDFVYVAQNETTFSGRPGTTASGEAAGVGGGYNDNLSLAPAVEYNWSSTLGFVAGVQFSVYGRNSGQFANGQISMYWLFGPM